MGKGELIEQRDGSEAVNGSARRCSTAATEVRWLAVDGGDSCSTRRECGR
jgi:hypothetical protein